MLLPELQHLLKFLDYSPQDEHYTCIFPLARQKFRRCSNPVNKKDRQSAQALRDEICGMDPFEDGIDAYLESYAQLCCCTRYHRAEVGDPGLIKQLCLRWKKELRSAYPVHNRVIVATIAGPTVIPIKDEIENFLQPGLSTLKTERLAPRDAATAYHDEVGYVKRNVSEDTDEQKNFSPSDKSGRTPRTRPENTLSTSASQSHQCPPNPAALASTVQLTRRITRSQTGSLAWSFTPRRLPRESTMLKLLLSPISEYSSQIGVIYIYTRASDPGFHKLGCTIREPKIRMGEWEKSCGYKPILLYVSDPVPNVRRLEALLQKDLSLRGHGRQETYCKHNKHCPRDHTEWFQVGLDEVVLLVKAWAKWMRDEMPYRRVTTSHRKDTPVAFIRGEWQRHFESLSQRKVEIRAKCLQLNCTTTTSSTTTIATRQVVAECEGVSDANELFLNQEACNGPKDGVAVVGNASRRGALPERDGEGDSDANNRASKRDDATTRSVDDNVPHPDIDIATAALVMVLVYYSALSKTIARVDDAIATSSSIFNAGSLGTSSSLETFEKKRPPRQIMAC